MSTLTLWTRRDPFAEFDAIVRRAFNPAAGFTPSAEIVRDGDDAVVRLELPGIDVEKDVTVVTGVSASPRQPLRRGPLWTPRRSPVNACCCASPDASSSWSG